jgi:hypothetical protein
VPLSIKKDYSPARKFLAVAAYSWNCILSTATLPFCRDINPLAPHLNTHHLSGLTSSPSAKFAIMWRARVLHLLITWTSGCLCQITSDQTHSRDNGEQRRYISTHKHIIFPAQTLFTNIYGYTIYAYYFLRACALSPTKPIKHSAHTYRALMDRQSHRDDVFWLTTPKPQNVSFWDLGGHCPTFRFF